MRRILLCSLPLALALTACGGEDEAAQAEAQTEEAAGQAATEPDETEAAARAQVVAEGFVAALVSDDAEAACALTEDSAQSAIIAQSEGAGDCQAAFPDYRAGIDDVEAIEIGDISVSTDLDGDTFIANVELDHPGESPGVLEVRESSDGEWRATRVPGTTIGGG